MKGWHFVGDTLRDGSPIPEDGVPLIYEGELKICQSGLHFSEHPFDALQYAPGNTLCMVECEGLGDSGNHKDKHVCSKRTIIKRIDAENLLREFAREQALSVIHLWDAPEVVVQYLESGDESIKTAARDAARAAGDAAWDAARAAGAAAGYAAWDAAEAAWDAAWAAARAAGAAAEAAGAAAGAAGAAGAAAWAAGAAAWDAGAAAWDAAEAARAAARDSFLTKVEGAFK